MYKSNNVHVHVRVYKFNDGYYSELTKETDGADRRVKQAQNEKKKVFTPCTLKYIYIYTCMYTSTYCVV